MAALRWRVTFYDRRKNVGSMLYATEAIARERRRAWLKDGFGSVVQSGAWAAIVEEYDGDETEDNPVLKSLLSDLGPSSSQEGDGSGSWREQEAADDAELLAFHDAATQPTYPPFVHPEPGDRAGMGTEFVQQVEAIERGNMDEPLAEWEEALLREDRWLATIWPTYPNGRLRSDEHNLKLARSIMALADAEVAAAVAAVRADLAARLLAERLDPEDVTSFWYEGINAGLARALAIVRDEL